MAPWGYAVIALIWAVRTDTGRSVMKSVMKAGMKVGVEAKEHLSELAEKANDYKEGLMSEIRADEVEAEKAKENSKSI